MLYAKSKPVETIREHTDRLLDGLNKLRAAYGPKIGEDDAFWDLLRLAVTIHDFGKANLVFQNKIRRKIGERPLPCSLSPDDEIPHNYVSVALLPYKQLELTKEQWQLLVYAVGFHHERGPMHEPDRKRILQFMQEAMPAEMLQEVCEHMQYPYLAEKPSQALLNMLEKRQDFSDSLKRHPQLFRRYVLLKGLLHRLDHAASALVDPEIGTDEHPGMKARRFIERYQLRPAQQFAAEHAQEHAVMVASTGTGKTEAALLWADEDKTFITLPLRVSLNAMFDRLRKKDNVGLECLGLLHSGSFDFLMERDALDAEESYRISRQLAKKVTLSTIDQILKFPFLYRGFEKELATMAYAKLVIDEIQAYDPEIAAMLIKALEMIAEIGGKFMVMTATMPQLYLDELRYRMANLGSKLAYGEFPNDELLRHRVTLSNQSMLDVIPEIAAAGQQKKVLVICNTVDRAIEVFEVLRKTMPKDDKGKAIIPIRLLHARFMQKHKMALEQLITSFAQSGWHERETGPQPGIWVTTQVVEASVDVDFDVLYTEACTLDSLFQRMGRCYRVRPYNLAEANIHILTDNVSGVGSVYDQKLTADSLSLLAPFAGELLKESDKMRLVQELYSRENLKGTNFLHKFDQALSRFDNQRMFDLSSQEGQQLLRKITNRDVIPPPYWNTALQLAEQYAAEQDSAMRRKIRRELGNMTVSINAGSLNYREIPISPMSVRGLEYLHYIDESDVEYEFDESSLEGAGLIYKRSPSFL